jgi:hypothetical protein
MCNRYLLMHHVISPFIIWFYPRLLYYDVSMDEVIELGVVIPTTDVGCKSYCHFRINVFFQAG